MKANRMWLFPLAVVCLALVGISNAHAGKKKAKTEAMTLKIANLTMETPAKEVKKLEKTVKKVKGVKRVAVSKKKGELTVRHTAVATVDAIKEAVAKAGFDVVEPKQDDAEPGDEPAGEEPAGEEDLE